MKPIRLDKYLCEFGIGTRTEVKQYLKKGRVSVDGAKNVRPEMKVTGENVILFDGQRLEYQEWEYFMFHKPAGCVSATEDRTHKTVLDYITDAARQDLFPVGRLDIDTEGLLLITNDGVLAHNLLSPKKHVKKTYYARVTGKADANDQRAFLEGLDIGDETPARPAELEIINAGAVESEVRVTITEGRFHEIKRMFEAIGKEVLYLRRISMGPLMLDPALKPGEYRKLTEDEISSLQNTK